MTKGNEENPRKQEIRMRITPSGQANIQQVLCSTEKPINNTIMTILEHVS